KTIPIVIAAGADPVETGLIVSLAHPGGNVTGLSMRSSEVTGKRLELLKDVVPRAHRVGFLWNPNNPSHTVSLKDSQTAVQKMGLQLQSIALGAPSELDEAFKTITRERIDAFTILRDSFFLIN